MKQNYMKMLSLFLVLLFSSYMAQSQALLTEDFDYPIGDILTSHGWAAHSGAGTNPIDVTTGLSFAGYAGSGIGGAANIDNTGEDVNRLFTGQTAGAVYVACIVQTQATNAAGYFLNLSVNPINTTYISRLWVNATGDQLGIGSTAVYTPITVGVPTLAVIKYDIATKVSSLFVFNTFPTSEPGTANATFTETATLTNIGAIALRQYSASQRIIVDGIRIATTWADAVAPAGPSAPSLTTEDASNVLTTTATGNGTLVSTGNADVTVRGFCWDLAANADPDVNDSKTVENGNFTPGSYTAAITSLTPNTTYKVRAYATNSAGTGYGNVMNFTTAPLTPFLSVDPTALSGFGYAQGSGPSAQQNFSASGLNLTANVSIVPPSHYEISTLTGAAFVATNPITLTPSSGTLNATNIYVRLKAGLAAGTYDNENITVSSTGASAVTVSCSGSVTLPATQLAFVNFPANGNLSTAVSSFSVEARRADNTVDNLYAGNITLVKASGPGVVGGTLTQPAVAGVATFNDITFDAVGSYTLTASSGSLTPATSTSIYIVGTPTLSENLIPLYMEGMNGTNNDRIPLAYRVTLSGLIPSATYRFINQMVISTDSPTTNGAGNVIFVNPDGTFVRTSSPSLETTYGSFTADANGSYTGWFAGEPTGNARFTPGNQIYMRIRLNNGLGGTTVSNYVTTSSYVTVLGFGTQPSDTEGTAIRCESDMTPKNFAFIFQNTAGTGRPLYGTHIETTEVDYSAVDQYSDFYQNIVAGVNGSWGGIVPNNNPQGVKRIEERSLSTGEIVNTYTSDNAVWNGVNSSNPVGGTVTPIVILLNATTDPQFILSPEALTSLDYLDGEGPSASQTYTLMGLYLNPGQVTVTAPASFEISSDDAAFGNSLVFNIVDGNIEYQPVTIYVRLKAGLAVGVYSENITHSGGAAPDGLLNVSGTVIGPMMTELPYSEDFTAGLGLCYAHSVSGAGKYWLHSSSGGYAYMNGYNTGELEEDWLILPGINFDNYDNVVMSFETWMRYGADDADNYFKLMYSTDYEGIGDPSLSNWTELTFAYPTAEETWTPSGLLDLSSINGTNVYIAIAYHYNASFYRLWEVDNILITADAGPTLSVTPSTLNGFTYIEGYGPSVSQSYELSGSNLVGAGDISLTAPTNFEISADNTSFSSSMAVPFADGIVTNQPVVVSARLKADLLAGAYTDETISHTGGDAVETFVTLNGTVTLLGEPEISAQVLPMFMEGLNDVNNDRIPFAYRATLSNLTPNAIYRYINQIVISTDDATTNGAGNVIFASPTGDFVRTTSPALDTDGSYGTFLTDASGSYTGWFVSEPTGNARFTPGNYVSMRIRLNDGNDGIEVAHRLTTSDSTRVLTFGVEADEIHGTALRAVSGDSPKDFVFLYDNASGTGRPLYGASIEATGIDFSTITSYSPFFKDFVAGINGSWAAIIPNVNANGVQLIQVLDLGSGEIEKSYHGTGSLWGTTETANPAGGITDVLVIDLIEIGVDQLGEANCKLWATQNELVIESNVNQELNVQIYNLLGQAVLHTSVNGTGTHRLNHYLKTGTYVVRVSTNHQAVTSKMVIR